MAKTKKKAKRANDFPEKPMFKSLKVGDSVFYLTPYTVDKTQVEKIDVKNNTCILKNQVKVSTTIMPDGSINRIGDFKEKATIKIWSDSVEDEYIYHVAKKSIPNDLATLNSMIADLPKDSVIVISNKIKKLINKFKI